MPTQIQDFRGADCDNIVAQGDVVLKRRYVRTTLIEESLDQQLLAWERDDGTLLKPRLMSVRLGLPLSLLAAEDGLNVTRPQSVERRERQPIQVGADAVTLPGSRVQSRGENIIRVDEYELLQPRSRKGGVHERLSGTQIRNLLKNREITVARKDGGWDIIRVAKRRLQPLPATAPQQGPQEHAANLAFSTYPGYIYRHLVDVQFGGSVRAAIEAFLADPRAGAYHDDQYPQNSVITALPDNSFEVLFSIIQRDPLWDRATRTAATPELPQFLIGLVHVFEQTQTLVGFSRGRLLESVTLGPEESVTVEVFTFDRSIEQREETREIESESQVERTRNQSQEVEISNDIENTVGASVGAELGVSLPIEAVSVDASVNNDVSAEIVTRNQNTATLLSEASSRAAERYKATHQVKTLTRRETGAESRTTRNFRNPNLGRTLNLHHFEVMVHYETETRPVEDPQFCLLVETPQIGPFDRDWIRAYHDFLDVVLPHDAYRKGLEAANLLAAQEWMDELAAAEKKAREEELQRVAETQVATPPENYLPNKGIFATARRLREKLGLFVDMGTMEDAVLTIADHINPFTGVSVERLGEAEDLLSKWAWWAQIEAAYPGVQTAGKTFTEAYDEIAARSSDPAAPDDMVAALGDFVERFDDDWLMALKLFGAAYVAAELMILPAMANPAVYLYIMKLLYLPNDKGIPKTVSSARADFAQHKARQSAETLMPPAPPEPTLKPENLPPKPPRAYSEKELAQAHADMGRLILHLQENAAHYNNEYYKREDPSLRMDRLTQLGVARFVSNRLLGFAGTRSIYPLNVAALPPETQLYLAGLRPDPATLSNESAKTAFSVPSGGFVSEAVLGQCDALEPYLVERRALDLEARRLENELLRARVDSLAAGATVDASSPVG